MFSETLAPPWDEISEVTTTASLVDTLSTTEHSYSTSRTVPGPGALSGKAILALGKATLRAAENLVIRTRLQALSSAFPHTDEDSIKGLDQMYKDVMELSRRDLYPDAVRIRALHIILVQIGSREVEKLVQYLGKWPSVEIKIFIREITELFNILRLIKGTGPPSILVQAYRGSINSREDHHFRPLIYFFRCLAYTSDRASTVILESGVIELLAHLHASDYSDPLVPTGVKSLSRKGSGLQTSCENLLIICSSTQKGLDIIHRNWLYPLLPATDASQTPGSLLDRQVRRAEAWRLLEVEVVLLRAQTIFKMMVLEGWRGQLTQNSFEDIGADILEFCGHGTYPEDVKNYILEMVLVLIGSRKTKILIDCISTWPLAGIQSFIPWLAKMLNPLWLSHPETTGCFPLSLALGYHISFSTNRPHESIILFLTDLSHSYNFIRQTAYQNAEQRLNNTEELSFHEMWPQLPFSPLSNVLSEPRGGRRIFWRSTKPEIVDRLSVLLGLIRMVPPFPFDSQSLADVVNDALEFFGNDQYGELVKSCAFDIILVLIGSRRTKELADSLVTIYHAQSGPFISEMAKIFNPVRLYAMKRADALPVSVQIYQNSLSSLETHSLQPLVVFFEQLAVAGPLSLRSAAIEFLHSLYLSDFFDPLFFAEISKKSASLLSPRAPYKHQLLSHINSIVYSLEGDTPNAMWQLQLPQVPSSEITIRLAERLRAWGSADKETVLFRINLILSMGPENWKEVMKNRNSFVPILAIADLMEFLGSPSMAPEIGFSALRCFCNLLTNGFSFGISIHVIFYDLVLRDPGRYMNLIARIFERLSYWQESVARAITIPAPQLTHTLRMLGTADQVLQWKEPEFDGVISHTLSMREILQVIDFFVDTARISPEFLDIILGANILGLLLPFLEQELRSDIMQAMTHDSELFGTYETDPEVLALLGTTKLTELSPSTREDGELSPVRRAVISHVFEVLP